MSPRRYAQFCLFFVILMPLQSSAADFTLRNQPLGPPIVGLGAQMNPYLYCRPNTPAVTEDNVKDLEQKILALRPQHVRIFLLNLWWTPQGDPSVARGDDAKASFIRVASLAQKCGATINATLWFGPLDDPERFARDTAATFSDLIRKHHLTAIRYV